MIKNSRFKTTYRLVFVLTAILGVTLNIFMMKANVLMMVSYYTIQSNVACLILMGIIWVKHIRNETVSTRLYQLKAAFTVMIFLTFLVYHMFLRPVMMAYGTDYEYNSFSNSLVHYVVPLMMLLDYILFDAPIILKKTAPFQWLIIPAIYWIYTLIYAVLGGRYVIDETVSRYPYFFMDFESLGFWPALGFVGLIVIIYLLIGYGFYGINYLSQRQERFKSSKES